MHDGTSNVAIGIDLGGSSTRAAVVDSAGSVLARIERPTGREESLDQLVTHLADDVSRLLVETEGESERSIRVGLAVPGTLDRTRTKLLRCVNLSGLQNTAVGTELAARLHLARTTTRRAERAVVGLAKSQPVDAAAIVYLNRLSDYLFALARRANHRAGVADTLWNAD